MKTLLLGIDALDPDVIKNVETPHIDSIGEGFQIDTHGNSGPSWASVMTGVPPDGHGVRVLNPQVDSQSWEGTPIWEKVKGYSGIANVPLTYPPDPDIRGWMVSGLMTPSRAIYTAPRSLYKKLDELDYRIDVWIEGHQNHPHGHYGTVPFEFDEENRVDLLERLRTVLDRRGRAFRWLIHNEPVDFAFLCFTTLDRVQHLAMHDREVVYEFYRRVDEEVGAILDCFEVHDAEIIVVSDHGMTEVDIPKTDLTGEHRMEGYGATNFGKRFATLEMCHDLAVESANRTDVDRRLKDLGYIE